MDSAGLVPVATTSPPLRLKPPEPKRTAICRQGKAYPSPDAMNQGIVADTAAMPRAFEALRTGARTLDND
jgi:hypothetical protein